MERRTRSRDSHAWMTKSSESFLSSNANSSNYLLQTGSPKKTRWMKLKESAWNKQKGTSFGRTPKEWGQLGLFYLIFYTCLICFFMAMMSVYTEVIQDTRTPTLYNDKGVNLGVPSMSIRPVPFHLSTFIKFVSGNRKSYIKYLNNIEAFLDRYSMKKQLGPSFYNCRHSDRPLGKACRFELSNLGPCFYKEDYGYEDGEPCVILKLNKMYGWVPELYTNDTRPPELGDRWHPDYIGVSCEGRFPPDKEYIGPIDYYPPYGFHRKFYPYINQLGYRAPVVAIQFMGIRRGLVVQVECKAWAKNIRHDWYYQLGQTQFELQVD